ncbi:AP3-complex subunit beta-A isoform X1 [Physcomitrium patens]|uniref:AP-3 complex subunit beta n=2 Tax=Physcomitrium patens TaxID=3218 RepID=A0A2K1K710_PHYPA|nr:AP3-complex subunit beta-A-like isoform X1 [Physcomitrium patens]PNR49562.1 hypothetical protein PHYPA_011458 [Physcomitrium patens]|eukprot:XP_024383635.1 AP3-complex subunit beta-A-like isoform X1 [Physcomitrella patens]
MFPQFASTAASLTRATSLMNRVGTDAYLYDDPEDGNIAMLLDSKFEVEKVEGMKRLIALVSQGRDVSSFFPQVVKNVATTSLEVKKLVYIYLVHYAEKRPDEALLSINSFQKDLSDLNPLVRAWSLRAMSGIRVRVVVPLVVMAVTKCTRDPSPYVRRCAAHAIPKIHAIERDLHKEALEEMVDLLLNDSSPSVIGAAASAFLIICPEKLSILGPRFRKLCEMLPDVDEWGQAVLLDILMRYAVARYGCVRGAGQNSCARNDLQHKVQKMHSTDNSDHSAEEASEVELPADIRGLLHWSTPLFRSQNSAVVMAVATLYWVFAPDTDLKKIVQPLLFLLRSSKDSHYVVLANIATFALQMPPLFASYFEEFFVRSFDTDPIRALKLDILTTIATEASIHTILREFQAYLRDVNRQFAANTVSAIGRCAVRLPAVRSACVDGLLMLAKGVIVGDGVSHSKDEAEQLSCQGGLKMPAKEKLSQEAGVVAQSVLALRSIVQQNPSEQEQVFARLVRLLDHMKVPEARAVVIWMVGEEGLNSELVSQMLPVVLRYLAVSFTKEADETKLQILNCAAKIVLKLEEASASILKETATLVLEHTLNLSDLDTNNDIRDRARMLRRLVLPKSHVISQSKNREIHLDLAQQMQSLGVDNEATNVSNQEPKTVLGANGHATFQLSRADVLTKLAKQLLLVPKAPPVLPALAPDRSSFLPGTMSHIVNHNAPGYTSLPKPHSLDVVADGNTPGSARDSTLHKHERSLISGYTESGTEASGDSGGGDSDGYSDDSGPYDSGSEDSRNEESSSSQNILGKGTQIQGQGGTDLAPLISMDDESAGGELTKGNGSLYYGLPVKSDRDLDSWLDSQDVEAKGYSQTADPSSLLGYASISLGPLNPVLSKITLLDYTNGDGLDVKYTYVREPAICSQEMVCLRLYFFNRSGDPMLKISVKGMEEPASVDNADQAGVTSEGRKVISFEEIAELAPGDTIERDLQVEFKHQLTPIKLFVVLNGKTYPAKIAPEVGALVCPLQLTRNQFITAQSRISGMLESSRRCLLGSSYSQTSNTGDDKILFISRAIASSVLRVAHVAVVSATLPISDAIGFSGLQLCFAGETLTERLKCLISVTFDTENAVLIKVNCEDTVFGLNLLKQLETILSS